jgi:hypothetical protein
MIGIDAKNSGKIGDIKSEGDLQAIRRDDDFSIAAVQVVSACPRHHERKTQDQQQKLEPFNARETNPRRIDQSFLLDHCNPDKSKSSYDKGIKMASPATWCDSGSSNTSTLSPCRFELRHNSVGHAPHHVSAALGMPLHPF